MRTEKCYADWVRRFILFHNKCHPWEMGAPEVEAFLTHQAVDRNVAPRPRSRRWRRFCFSTAMYSKSTCPG
ncbi:MAG: site-specific integrase [Wenzhouxiangellaceae bacterium]